MIKGKNSVYIYALLVILFFLCSISYLRNDLWANELRLWNDIAFKSPGDARARNNFGGYLKESGYLDKALEEFFFVIKSAPDAYEPYNNIGLIYREKKQYSRALGYILKAIELRPTKFEMQYNVAVLYDDMGLPEDALFRYRIFLSLVSPAYEYQINYALKRVKILEGK